MVDLSIFINSVNPQGLPACLYWIAQNVVNNPLRIEILSREITPDMKEFSSVLRFSLIGETDGISKTAESKFLLTIDDTIIPWKNSLQYLLNNCRAYLECGNTQFVLPTIYKIPSRANEKLDKYKANLTQKMVDYCLAEPPKENPLSVYACTKEVGLSIENYYGLENRIETCPEVLFLNQEFAE